MQQQQQGQNILGAKLLSVKVLKSKIVRPFLGIQHQNCLFFSFLQKFKGGLCRIDMVSFLIGVSQGWRGGEGLEFNPFHLVLMVPK